MEWVLWHTQIQGHIKLRNYFLAVQCYTELALVNRVKITFTVRHFL